MAKVFFALLLLAALPVRAGAQMIDDGVMLPKRALFTGGMYSWDRWSEYWEGTLRRENGNIGTITTEVNTWYANYGVTDRLNVIGAVPYVWTNASQGVLAGINGLQDLTLAAKYSFVERETTGLRAIGVFSAAIPMTDYNPELLPLSIGLASTRFTARGTLNYHTEPGWFVNATGGHTWRTDVTLDRPYFFTGDDFVMSDQVDMPGVVDYTGSAGYMKGPVMIAGMVSQQWTLGGDDIRRQDMPLVSNRMNATRLGVMGMYPVPKLRGLVAQGGYAYTLAGRNVGQARTFSFGLLYSLGSAPR